MDQDLVKSRRRIPGWLLPSLGYTLSALSLVWVLHGFNLQQTLADLASLDWRYVSIAVICELAVYLSHAWRWNMLLRPVAQLPFWRSVQAIYIGLYANDILPLRTGEAIRCYLVAHWNGIPVSLAVTSAVIERILDGALLLIALVVTARRVTLPGYLFHGTELLAIGLCFLLGLLIFVAVHKQKAHAVLAETKWMSGLRHIVEEIHSMGNWRTMLPTAGASLVYLILQIIPVWALMESFGLDLSVWAAAAVFIVQRFGTVVPNAPGNFGLQQYFCVVGLIGGFVALALTGLKLGDIRTRAHTMQAPVGVASD